MTISELIAKLEELRTKYGGNLLAWHDWTYYDDDGEPHHGDSDIHWVIPDPVPTQRDGQQYDGIVRIR